MEDSLKIYLVELIIGLREPITGMEKHFLKVVKEQAIACTAQEKIWYKWWLSIQNKGVELRKPQIQENKMQNALHSTVTEENHYVQKIQMRKHRNFPSEPAKGMLTSSKSY